MNRERQIIMRDDRTPVTSARKIGSQYEHGPKPLGRTSRFDLVELTCAHMILHETRLRSEVILDITTL